MTGPDANDLSGLEFPSSASYTIIEEIGRGGMGIVFLAEKDAEGVADEVCLKTLRSLSPEAVKKLKKEANIAAALRQENIVKTYGLESISASLLPAAFRREIDGLSADKARRTQAIRRVRKRARRESGRPKLLTRGKRKQDERRLYMLVMDYVDGTDLRTLHRGHVKSQRLLPCLLSAFVVSRVSRALDYAHTWIVHRDISPENILIDQQGVTKLTDFGLAIPSGVPPEHLAGKLCYMSPEQLRGEALDARSDIYSLGIVMYQLLTGLPVLQPPASLPFARQLEEALRLAETCPRPAPHLVRSDIPKVLSEICMRMLERKHEKRLPRALDVCSLLEQKFLYARGFGPTNNSLACYIRLAEKSFKGATQDDLRQLKFLQTDAGRIRLQRTLHEDDYTPTGRELLAAYRAYPRG